MNLFTFRRPTFKASDPAALLFIPRCLIKALRIKAAVDIVAFAERRPVPVTALLLPANAHLCAASRMMIYNLILK